MLNLKSLFMLLLVLACNGIGPRGLAQTNDPEGKSESLNSCEELFFSKLNLVRAKAENEALKKALIVKMIDGIGQMAAQSPPNLDLITNKIHVITSLIYLQRMKSEKNSMLSCLNGFVCMSLLPSSNLKPSPPTKSDIYLKFLQSLGPNGTSISPNELEKAQFVLKYFKDSMGS